MNNLKICTQFLDSNSNLIIENTLGEHSLYMALTMYIDRTFVWVREIGVALIILKDTLGFTD